MRPAAASQQRPDAAHRAEIAPRGQRDVKDIAYGDWQKLCFKPGGAKMLCRTSITGTFTTGQMAVRLDIVEREGDDARRLQLFAPVGMYLPKPVKITVDQGEPYRVPYSWCLTNACIAATSPIPRMIQEMNQGKALAAGIRRIRTSCRSQRRYRLAQFAAVHKGAPAQTLEQDIDE